MYKIRYLLFSLFLFSAYSNADDMAREPVKVVLSHSKAKSLGFIIEERNLRNGSFFLDIKSPDVLKNGKVYKRFGNKALDSGVKKQRNFLGANMTLLNAKDEIAFFSIDSTEPRNSISISVDPKLVSRIKAHIFYEYYDGLEAPISLRYEIRSNTKIAKK